MYLPIIRLWQILASFSHKWKTISKYFHWSKVYWIYTREKELADNFETSFKEEINEEEDDEDEDEDEGDEEVWESLLNTFLCWLRRNILNINIMNIFIFSKFNSKRKASSANNSLPKNGTATKTKPRKLVKRDFKNPEWWKNIKKSLRKFHPKSCIDDLKYSRRWAS